MMITTRTLAGKHLLQIATLCGAVAVGACGGLSSSGEIERGGQAKGSANGFSSIFLNGTRFNTDNAAVTINGTPASESDLSVGMQLTITGNINDGIANTVTFAADVRGPIDSANQPDARPNMELSVLGQTVLIDELTVFDGVAQNELNTDMSVTVSGLQAGDGSILATYIALEDALHSPATAPVSVTGTASAVTAGTLSINDLTVDIASVDTTGVSDGVVVRASGLQLTRGGPLSASSLSIVDTSLGEPGDALSLEGIVSNLDDNGFELAGARIDTRSAVRGDTSGFGLTNGVRVTVEGVVVGPNAAQADSITLLPPAELGVIGELDGRDSLTGALLILGQPVQTLPSTQYLDLSAQDERTFRDSSLRDGETVHALGHIDFAGRFVATRIERLNPPSNVPGENNEDVLRGRVSNPVSAEGRFSVAPFSVTTGTTTVFRDADNNVITAAEFFDNLTPTSFALVRGTAMQNGTFAATSVRQQDRGASQTAAIR